MSADELAAPVRVRARDLVREAGELAAEYAGALAQLEVRSKAVQDVVTEADLEVELLIKQRLADAFRSTTRFLGEETGAADVADAGGIWVVDPIDGTQPFVSGMTSWCVSIAYVRDGVLHSASCTTRRATSCSRAAAAGRRCSTGGRSPRTPGRRSPTASWPSATRRGSAPDDILPVFDRLLRRGGMFYRNGSGALTPLLRRLRPAARLRRAAHQLLGLPRRHRGGHARRAGGPTTTCRATRCSPGNRIVAGPPAVFDALDAVLGS